MRVMVIVKASPESEAGILPSPELLAEMGKFNEQLIKAGVMQAGDGLKSSAHGVRVKFDQKKTVIGGPFAETKELVAGFWLWKVNSIEDAVTWLKRAPFGGGTEVEFGRCSNPKTSGARVGKNSNSGSNSGSQRESLVAHTIGTNRCEFQTKESGDDYAIESIFTFQ